MNLLFFFLARTVKRGRDYSGLDYIYSINDLSAPIFFIVITIIVLIVASTKYQNNSKQLYRHFLACYFLKIIGCLAFVSIYTFYYGGGDTFRYFRNTKPLMSMSNYSPETYVKVLSQRKIVDIRNVHPEFRENFKEGHQFDMQHDKTGFLIVRFASLFGIFGFRSYLTISLLFATMSTFGVWALYRTFTRLFPGHENAISIPIIYFPSVWFWGSSIMKDSVVICFLGILTYAIYNIFIRKKYFVTSILSLVISIYCLITTKEYVIIAYVPALLLWIILSISNNFPRWLQIAFRPILLLIAIASIFVVGPKVGEVSEKYAIESVLETAETTGAYISRISTNEDGSVYSLGDVSYTPKGLVTLFPRAVTVTLYQPFIFQAKNPVMLLSAIESTLVLLTTLFVIFRLGPLRFAQTLSRNPFLIAALTFSVFFAFAIGASTFNYGSLARYKLPCLPFYGLAIILPYSMYRKNKKKFLESNAKIIETEAV